MKERKNVCYDKSANYEAFRYEAFGVMKTEEKIAYSENHTRQINTLYGKHARYFNVKTGGTNKSHSDFDD
jgi:hypothetical protein